MTQFFFFSFFLFILRERESARASGEDLCPSSVQPLLWENTALGNVPVIVSLQVKPFLFLILWLVSLGSTPTKRQAQVPVPEPLCEKRRSWPCSVRRVWSYRVPSAGSPLTSRTTPLIPPEQAAAGHRKQSKGYSELLKKQVGNAERQLEIQVSEVLELKLMVKKQSGGLHSEYILQHFLEEE